jgi:hypothetical protein
VAFADPQPLLEPNPAARAGRLAPGIERLGFTPQP